MKCGLILVKISQIVLDLPLHRPAGAVAIAKKLRGSFGLKGAAGRFFIFGIQITCKHKIKLAILSEKTKQKVLAKDKRIKQPTTALLFLRCRSLD